MQPPGSSGWHQLAAAAALVPLLTRHSSRPSWACREMLPAAPPAPIASRLNRPAQRMTAGSGSGGQRAWCAKRWAAGAPQALAGCWLQHVCSAAKQPLPARSGLQQPRKHAHQPVHTTHRSGSGAGGRAARAGCAGGGRPWAGAATARAAAAPRLGSPPATGRPRPTGRRRPRHCAPGPTAAAGEGGQGGAQG